MLYCLPFDVDSTIVARSMEGVGWTTILSEFSNAFVVTEEESILITDIILSVSCWAACYNNIFIFK